MQFCTLVSPLLALMRDQIDAAARLQSQTPSERLNANEIRAAVYSGDTDAEQRPEIEQRLKSNELKVVTATSALGMGFDKPDLSFVIHFQSPDSPVAYYQQVGRAGRAADHAEVVLLWGHCDEDIWKYFQDNSLPLQWHAEEVVDYLAVAAAWVGQRDIVAAPGLARQKRSRTASGASPHGAVTDPAPATRH